MTNVEKLTTLYSEKVKTGLVDVKFSFKDSARFATIEQLAGEILLMEEAIAAGKSKPLDFGDYNLNLPRYGIGPIRPIVR